MTLVTQTGKSSGRRMRGFERASSLVTDRIRNAGEKRGFAVARLLTHWAEIAGDATARVARPVKIGYGRDGMGATLTLLTTGAAAPMVQMQLPQLRDRVNACYGYNAISRIVLTQTAAAGFAEAQTAFRAHADLLPDGAGAPGDPKLPEAARALSAPVGDAGLRAALEALAGNVLSRPRTRKG
jgi:hypothetical protein